MRNLTVVFVLLVCFCRVPADYPLLPVHPRYAGPSNEPGQIQVDGLVTKVSLFHGWMYDEADWHVYINTAPQTSRDLADFLRAQRSADVNSCDLENIYSELMTLDKYKKAWIFGDDKFYSADFTSSFLLFKRGSAHPAWDLGLEAIDDQSTNHDFSGYSRLIGARAYLQGAFVQDAAKDEIQVEIHPLDSIAFAMDSFGVPLSVRREDPGWPRTFVRWRVGVFANSSHHRINDESYADKERTTTWFLDLPRDASAGGPATPGNITVLEERQQLWDGGRNTYYSGRRWKTLVPWTIAVDPKDGRKKLKVTTTMHTPDKWGGIIVRDYTIQVNAPNPQPLRSR